MYYKDLQKAYTRVGHSLMLSKNALPNFDKFNSVKVKHLTRKFQGFNKNCKT